MTPYSIHCSTCHARLKVRKAHAIGSIVNCPGCGAMVQVSPPPPPGAADVASPPGRRRGQTPSLGSDMALSEECFNQICSILDQPPCVELESHEVEVPDETSGADADGSAKRSGRGRRWLLLAAGTLGATLVFVTFLQLSDAQTVQRVAHNSVMSAPPPLARPLRSSEPAAEPGPVDPPAHPPAEVPAPGGTELTTSPSLPAPDVTAQAQVATTVASPPPRDEAKPNVLDGKPAEIAVAGFNGAATEAAMPLFVAVQPVPHPGSREALIARLKQSVGLRLAEQPFPNFVSDIERLVGAPITVEAEGFVQQRAGLQAGITLDVPPMPLGRAIQAALRPTGLEIALQDGHLVIHSKDGVARDDARFAKHEVSDLTSGGGGGELVSMIRMFVAPEQWDSGGGTAQLAMTGDALVVEGASTYLHHEVRNFCEQLRAHRGLARLSTGHTTDLRPAWVAGDRLLTQRHTLHIIQPVRLDELFRRVSEISSVECWVDWRQLSEIGVSPTDRVRMNVESQQLCDILDAICHHVGAARMVTADVCEITSRQDEAETWEINFHRVDDLTVPSAGGHAATPQELIGVIYDAVGSQWFSPNRGAIEYDSASRCLIVRLPQSQQLTVEEQLRLIRT